MQNESLQHQRITQLSKFCILQGGGGTDKCLLQLSCYKSCIKRWKVLFFRWKDGGVQCYKTYNLDEVLQKKKGEGKKQIYCRDNLSTKRSETTTKEQNQKICLKCRHFSPSRQTCNTPYPLKKIQLKVKQVQNTKKRIFFLIQIYTVENYNETYICTRKVDYLYSLKKS